VAGKLLVLDTIFFLMLLILPPFLYPEVRYYKSNDIGMKLKEIREEDVDEYDYILLVEETTDMETRDLLSDNGIIKRWEYSLYNNRNVREERKFNGDTLESIYYYDRRGRLVEEHLYSGDLLTQKIVYFYSENQELDQIKSYDNTGNLLYEEYYEFNRHGMIRRVTRTWSDGRNQVSSFVYGHGQLVEETYSSDGEMTISRYDETGNLTFIEVWEGDEQVREKMFFYNKTDESLLSTLEKDLSQGIETESRFNTEGWLIEETVSKDDKTVYKQVYTYDNEGRKATMKKTSDRGLEEWSFYYDSEGDLNREEYYNRGMLERRTVYTSDNSYYEELYRYGELLIRVYYEDEAKIREEFIDDGEVIKVKDLEASE
jgi:hypothetical protein